MWKIFWTEYIWLPLLVSYICLLVWKIIKANLILKTYFSWLTTFEYFCTFFFFACNKNPVQTASLWNLSHHVEHWQRHVASVLGVSSPSKEEMPSDSVPTLPKLAWRSTEPELTPSRCAWACKQRAFSMSCMRMKRPWVWQKNIPGKKGTLLEQVVIFCYSGAAAYEPQLSWFLVFSGKNKHIN